MANRIPPVGGKGLSGCLAEMAARSKWYEMFREFYLKSER